MTASILSPAKPFDARAFDPAVLPAISPLAQELLALDLDADSAEHRLLVIVESDPQLAVRLLSLANSVAYAHHGTTLHSVRDAMHRIGLVRTLHLATGMLFAAPLRGRLSPQLAESIWLHALTLASAAFEVARLKRTVDKDDAYLCGLVHNLGYMAEEILAPGALQSLGDVCLADRLSLEDAERQMFQTDHAAIATRVLEHWKAPQDIIVAIRSHHDLDIEPGSLAAILFGAEKLARFSELGDALYTEDWHPFSGLSIDRDGLDFLFDQQLELTSSEVTQLVERIVAQVESFRDCARAICVGH